MKESFESRKKHFTHNKDEDKSGTRKEISPKKTQQSYSLRKCFIIKRLLESRMRLIDKIYGSPFIIPIIFIIVNRNNFLSKKTERFYFILL